MQRFILNCLVFLLLLGGSFSTFGDDKSRACMDILNWIYRELKLTNLDASYQRLTDKLLLGLYKVHEETTNSFTYNTQMAQAFNSLKKIDPSLEEYIGNNLSVTITNFFSGEVSLSPSNFKKVITEWKDLQTSSPELFEGLEDLKLDEWDMLTVDILDTVSDYDFKDSNLKQKLSDLADTLSQSSKDVLNKSKFNEQELRKNINSSHKELIDAFNNNYNDVLNDYQTTCSAQDMKLTINSEQLVCPLLVKDTTIKDINDKLLELSEIIKNSFDFNREAPRLIEIGKVDYETSTNPKSTLCKRKPELASMIVIHHTGTESDTTPQKINSWHLDNGGEEDPWYMIGYNYVISDSYNNATASIPKVFEGRPPEYKGAHAGGFKKLSAEEKLYYKDKTISCGNPTVGFTTQPVLDQLNANGEISGNLASFGVAVIGDYSSTQYRWNGVAYVPKNINGSDKPRDPSKAMIDSLATLACQIQRKNRRTSKIVPHSYFTKTACPGTVINFLNDVKDKANSIAGCHFTVSITKEGDD
jgi:hypothetical protein